MAKIFFSLQLWGAKTSIAVMNMLAEHVGWKICSQEKSALN